VLRWGELAILGCASLALGALTPWVLPSHFGAGDGPTDTSRVQRLQAGPPVAAAAPREPERRSRGVIAIGDTSMLDAERCLEDRGITVHPRSVDTPEELLSVVRSSTEAYAVVFVHIGAGADIVDGQITRAIDMLGSDQRIVWATVQIPDPYDGTFSFEERANASIRNVVSRHPEGRVLDWNAATVKHPDWTVDGFRMSADGCRAYAAKVVKLSGLPQRA
jgi:hypothetical protein